MPRSPIIASLKPLVAAGLVLAWMLFSSLPAMAIEIKEVKSAKGITAWLIEDRTNPIIALSLAFRGGAAIDPGGKGGLANLVSGLLDEGAGDLDSQAFQARLENLSISLSFDAGLDTFSGSLRTLTKNRDEAFRLLGLALTKPRFDADPVERIRSQILGGIRRSSENPSRIASRELFRVLFKNHPYSRPVSGTEDSVVRIKIADLRAFTAQRLARKNLFVSVVGDITAAELAPLLDKTFGTLPTLAVGVQVADIQPKSAGRVIIIEKQIPQSTIRFALPGVKRSDPDFYAAFIMNYVLGGGGFSSRLYDQVREKRGLAYSTFSYLATLDHAGLVIAGAGTVNARAGETVAVMREEMKRIAETGVSARELSDAKNFLIGSFPLRFRSSGRIASMMTGLQLENLGIDYWQRRNDLIGDVSLAQVNEAAKKLFNPDNMTMIVVGQPEGLTPAP